MGDLQNPPFSPVLTCFHARLAIFALMLWVRGLDVTFIRAVFSWKRIESILNAWRLNEEELVFTVCTVFDLILWFLYDCVFDLKQKPKRQRALKEIDIKKKRERDTNRLWRAVISLWGRLYGELQQFIDFQNCSALIVIPGCSALFIGHTQHLGLWSLSEKPQLSQQAPFPQHTTQGPIHTHS